MTANIKLNMDDAEVQKSLDEQRKKNEAVEKSYVGVAKQILKNERQSVNAAKRIIKGQRDEKQILSDKIKALRTLGQTDSSQKQAANTAIKKLIAAERERQESIEATEAASTEAGRALRTQIDTGIRKTKELIAAEKTLDQKYDELRASITAAFKAGKIGADEQKAALRQLNKEQDAARKGAPFGGEFLSQVKSYAAGVLSVTAAVNAVKLAYTQFREEVAKGRDSTVTLRDARTSLLQVSDETNFNDRVSRADTAAAEFGVDRSESAKALFDAISNSVEQDFETILRSDRVIPAEIGAKFVGEFRRQFASEALTASQSLNLGLAAAGTSKFNVQEIQPQIRTAATGAGNLPGVDSSDVAALVSTLGVEFGARTGDQVKTLLANLGATRLTQLELLKTEERPEVRKILEENVALLSQDSASILKDLKVNDGLRQNIIKDNKQLLGVFSAAVRQFETFVKTDRTLEREVRIGGTSEDLVTKRLRAFESNPTLAADLAAQRAGVDREVSAETKFSRNEALREQRREDFNRSINENDGGEFQRFIGNRLLDFSDTLQSLTGLGEAADTARAEAENAKTFRSEFLKATKEQTDEARRQTDAINRLSRQPQQQLQGVD